MHRLYFIIIGVLCTLSYLLNYCSAIYQCAAVFTAIAIITNTSTSIYGRTKTIKGLVISLAVSFALLWKLPYYIDGKIINGLVLASFSSVIISLYWSTAIFQKMQRNFSFAKSNFFSVLCASIVDGVVMSVFFVINNNFTYARIIEICTREVLFKVMYGLIAYALLAFTLKAWKNNKNLKIRLCPFDCVNSDKL